MQRKIFACIMIGVVLLLVAFATWEMFRGNLAAAMSTFPVLVVVYLFVLAERGRRR
jgi:hypothetical protein